MGYPARDVSRLHPAALVLVTAAAFTDATAAAAQQATQLTAIAVTDAAEGLVVTLQATGPLPVPRSAALDNPHRVYLDLTDVRPAAGLAVPEPRGPVRAVRVALHSAVPLVTRVVIELTEARRYTVDRTARADGRLLVRLRAPLPSPPGTAARSTIPPGAVTTPAAPRAKAPPPQRAPASTPPQRAPASTPPQRAPASTPPPAAPASIGPLAAVLRDLDRLKTVLTDIDRRVAQPAGNLQEAAAAFDAMGAQLSGIKPSGRLAPARDLLVRACALAARAVRLRASFGADDEASWQAASAAAGALMLIDRAGRDIAAGGVSPGGGKE